MTDAPERIWATPCDGDEFGYGTYCDAATRPTAPNHDALCYVRANIHRSLAIDALAAETQAADAYAAQLKAEAMAAKLAEALRESQLQIDYLHGRLGEKTGSGNAVSSKNAAALAEYEASK